MNLINIKINNIKMKVLNKNYTILQICENLNIFIPRFCFHSKLSIAGNCRMCLVELKNSPKPIVACSMPIMPNMEIFTNTPLVKKTRESVLEFILINHPLDCPICDQGGECDLQEQTLSYGTDVSKFYFNKRTVQNKNCGVFIKTIMTRCIHCTRCVRFATEIANVPELGTVGRGNSTEITTFLEKTLISELSGNVIDLCPVGALTSKPYAFKARPWEINKKNTIDCLDSIGFPIETNVFNNKIIRILPKNNIWISDKTRFSYDGLLYQRILTPLLKKNNVFVKISWENVLTILQNKINKTDASKIIGVFDNLIDLESSFLIKNFFSTLGVSNIFSKIKTLNSDFNDNLLKINIQDIKNLDFILLIYCNTRTENTILNLYLKNNYDLRKTKIYVLGMKNNITYPNIHLGSDLKILIQISQGKHFISSKLTKSKKPLIIIGSQIFKYNSIKTNINILKNYFNVNTLFSDISSMNFNENNFNYLSDNNLLKNFKICFFFNLQKNIITNQNSFNIYQGSHFNFIDNNIDLILPSLTYLEKNSLYINNFGFLKKTNKIINNNIPKDFLVFKILFKMFNFNLKYNFKKIYYLMPQLKNTINYNNYKYKFIKKKNFSYFDNKKSLKLDLAIKDYYFNNNLSKNSKLMILHNKNLQKNFNNFTNNI